MEQFFSALSIFTSDSGTYIIGLVAALMIVLWDWRASLLGLLVIQLGVAALAVALQGMQPQWAFIQTLVILLCALSISISAAQSKPGGSFQQSGNWVLRIIVLLLLAVCWRLFDFEFPIPLIDPELNGLIIWLAVCAILMMSLSDNSLFTGTALLLWMIPMQVAVIVLWPIPSLIIILGGLELLLALGCSYLLLVENFTGAQRALVMTDISFPTFYLPAPAKQIGASFKSLPDPTQSNLRAVQKGQRLVSQGATNQKRPLGDLPPRPPAQARGERTGEHPIVVRLARKRSAPPSSQPEQTPDQLDKTEEFSSSATGAPSNDAAPNGATKSGAADIE